MIQLEGEVGEVILPVSLLRSWVGNPEHSLCARDRLTILEENGMERFSPFSVDFGHSQLLMVAGLRLFF